jgi:DNA invertase Pin-like site-specific DNA recombinase
MATRRYTEEDKQEIYRLWALHLKTREIAKKTNSSESHVTHTIVKGLANGDIVEVRTVKCK